MRVGYVAWRPRGDHGWGRYTVEVVRGVRALGIEPVLVTDGTELDPALAGIERHAILSPLFAGRFGTWRSLRAVPRLRRVLATCDVVHCLVEPYAPLVAWSRPRRAPYVQTVHGTWGIRPLESWRQRPLFAPAFRQADVLVLQSRFTRDRMARLVDLPRHVVWTGGVDPTAFERSPAVELPRWADGHPVALSVGAVKPRKGQHVALEAVGLARAWLPDVQYVVIGGHADGSGYLDGLRRRAAELGMADRLHLLGPVSFAELVTWYRRADVFVLLPVNEGGSVEGLGLVYLEAAAAGTPSIGTRDCGASEAIVDGETGLLVPQNDPRAAAEALRRLLGDPGLRARMGHAARARARELSWAALAGRLAALYSELLGAS